MANRYRNLIYSTAEYTHSYGGFLGVELSGGSLISSPARLAECRNMYRDYDGEGADVIESIPGFRAFAFYGETVHAIYYQRSATAGDDHLIVHVADRLMRHPVSDIYKENTVGVKIATLNNGKSFGFEYGRYFYVMDSKDLFRIDEDGACRKVGEAGAYPYVPTTYVSGEEYEMRNLLTRSFKEEYYIADPTAYLHHSRGLKISITDPYLRYCSVSGADGELEGDVYLPAYVDISGINHKVVSVDKGAFAGQSEISAIYFPHGIHEIGEEAFTGCGALERISLSATVETVGDRAFAECASLNEVYLGSGLKKIGVGAFPMLSGLTVNYALGEDELAAIEGAEEISMKVSSFYTRDEQILIELPLHDKVEGLGALYVDGVETEYGMIDNGEVFTGVTVKLPSIAEATGIKIVLNGELAPLGDDWCSDMTTLGTATPYQAIMGCTVAEVFDGRIFFSGNPIFPNTVFYTDRPRRDGDGALSIGRYNYFSDGVGSHKVKSLLAVRDMLAVFKEGDDGSGSIFYHKRESSSVGSLGTIYPVAYVHSGVLSKGGCLSFLDDPVFLTSEGLMALNNENINYQRNIVCRTHNVNYSLLKEDISEASLCEWLGYLVIGVRGKMYLADSRALFSHPAGSREYEWFVATDVGAYDGEKTVFRYSQDAYGDTGAHPTQIGDAVDYDEVYSASAEDGGVYYYVISDGVKYSVAPSEEKSGGVFSPATVFTSHAKHLFFATDDGHLCVFNNDMKGVAPESVKSAEGFDEEDYAESMGGKLHPLFYSFAGHAPTYTVKTAHDNCGVPHLTKSTVKKSLVIKAKSCRADAIRCEVVTDGADPTYVGSFPPADAGFDDFSFDVAPWYTSRYASTALPEKEKRWIEKQICLISDSFASPISIYSISYRYTIKGKIKNNF